MSYMSRHTGLEIDDGIDAANTALEKANTALQKGGGTMTGMLTLYSDPDSDMHAATKKYVDDEVRKIELTPGADGEPGADGVSPTISVEEISNGHRVTITNADGTTQSFDVLNGADGSGGDGSGDMLKSVYDKDGDNVVDDAAKLGGKAPSEYASADHAHSEYADAEHTHDEYALEDHAHDYVTSVNGQTGDVTIEVTGGGGSAGTVYSEDETATGDTWIDGKPIYSKVITATSLARGNGQVSLGVVLPTTMDTIVGVRGMFLAGTDGFYRTIPCANFAGLTYLFTALASKTGEVKLFIGSSYSTVTECTLIVEYTKN